MQCPDCKTVNPDSALLCSLCGKSLKRPCPGCGVLNKITANFCSNCFQSFLEQPAYQPYQPQEQSKQKLPKRPFFMILIGTVSFMLVNFTTLFRGNNAIFASALLITAGIALWGIGELVFHLLSQDPYTSEQLKIAKDFPAVYIEELSQSYPSFSAAEKELEETQTAVAPPSPIATLDHLPETSSLLTAQIEETVNRLESETNTQDTHSSYSTVAEFLTKSLDSEIVELQEKFDKSPSNTTIAMDLARLYEEKGDLRSAEKTLRNLAKRKTHKADLPLYYATLLHRLGKIEDAKKSLEKAESINPSMSKIFYRKGLLAASEKNYAEAKTAFQRCIQLAPDDPYAHYHLGMIYRASGDHDLAMQAIKRATILHPDDSYGHSKLGILCRESGNYAEALKAFSKALSLKPDDIFLYKQLAEITSLSGEYEKSSELYKEIIVRESPPKSETLIDFCKVLRKLNAYGDIEEIINEVLTAEPENKEALLIKAIACTRLEKYSEAKPIFKYLVTDPDVSYEAWLELGKIYQIENQSEKALVALVKAASTAPDQAGIWNRIGILLSKQQAYKEALAAFRKAASFDYTDKNISGNLAALTEKVEEDLNRIIEQSAQSISRNPDDAISYMQMGNAYEDLNRLEEAMLAYQKCISLQPDNINALSRYADILRKRGNLPLAIRCCKEILKSNPNHMETHLFLIQAYLNRGFVDKALRYATQAKQIEEKDPKLHFLLGKIYFAKGLFKRALDEFTIVSQLPVEPDMIAWAELMRRRLLKAKT